MAYLEQLLEAVSPFSAKPIFEKLIDESFTKKIVAAEKTFSAAKITYASGAADDEFMSGARTNYVETLSNLMARTQMMTVLSDPTKSNRPIISSPSKMMVLFYNYTHAYEKAIDCFLTEHPQNRLNLPLGQQVQANPAPAQ